MTLENRAARPQPYEQWRPTAASYASRTMMMSGIIVAVFIIYHLLHYTVMVTGRQFYGQGFPGPDRSTENRHDIYKMMVLGFQQPWVSLFYHDWRLPAVPPPEPRRWARCSNRWAGKNVPTGRAWIARPNGVAVLIFLGYISHTRLHFVEV